MRALVCFSRYVGDLGFQIGVAENIDSHQSTIPRSVTTRIVQKLSVSITFPSTREDLNIAKDIW